MAASAAQNSLAQALSLWKTTAQAVVHTKIVDYLLVSHETSGSDPSPGQAGPDGSGPAVLIPHPGDRPRPSCRRLPRGPRQPAGWPPGRAHAYQVTLVVTGIRQVPSARTTASPPSSTSSPSCATRISPPRADTCRPVSGWRRSRPIQYGPSAQCADPVTASSAPLATWKKRETKSAVSSAATSTSP